ncbi:MAG: hypothetical protein GY694_04840 [Gammaproteobacteria bacterium]|nr:hypothetical protein [Gammaproteobacteria bacterium]
MSNSKTKHQSNELQNESSEPLFKTKANTLAETQVQLDHQAPDNLMAFNPSANIESAARDLNTRLHEMETELQELSTHLDSSHQSLQQKTLSMDAELKGSKIKINSLEYSYNTLEKKSVELAQEASRLTLLLNESSQESTESIQILEQTSNKNFDQVSRQIKLLDEQVLQLVRDYNTLKDDSVSLISEVSLKANKLEASFSEHTGDFKKLSLSIEKHNDSLDSQLEQVGRNFSFHEAKIMKLHEKDTELDNKNSTLKDLLRQTKSEQKESVSLLEKRTSQVESESIQLKTEFQQVEQNHQEQLKDHDERLTTHNSNLHSHENRLENLKAVDDELSLRAEGLKKTTDRLDEHSVALEKTTVSLHQRSHDLQKSVIQLDKQNEQLEDKTDQLGIQIATNIQSERQHFQMMTMAISVVAILTVIALVYSFINQQSLWQSSMDNDVVIERRMNAQLSEQSNQVAMLGQQLKQTQVTTEQQRKNIEVLQTQLNLEQKKLAGLRQDSQEKSKKIIQLKGDLKDVDENVQFLNSSVGPLKDLTRNFFSSSEKQTLHNKEWLAKQPSESYSIQLSSVDSKQMLYQYIEKNAYSLQDDIAWFTINSKGKEYYILTYGVYKELAQARTVFSQLPTFVTENSPGIARMKDIQSFF